MTGNATDAPPSLVIPTVVKVYSTYLGIFSYYLTEPRSTNVAVVVPYSGSPRHSKLQGKKISIRVFLHGEIGNQTRQKSLPVSK